MHKNNVYNVILSRAVYGAFHKGYLSKANLFTWMTGEQSKVIKSTGAIDAYI